MKIEESIVDVGNELEAWWAEFSAMLDSEDRIAQGKMLLRGFEIVKEFDRLKAEGIAILTALLDRSDSLSADERCASLIHGFEFGARLADTLHDEFHDIADGVTKVIRITDKIVRALNRIDPNRVQLTELLSHRDRGVRALAGTYLIDLMPERVIPALEKIQQEARGTSAGLTAFNTLFAWEHGRVSRCGSPPE